MGTPALRYLSDEEQNIDDKRKYNNISSIIWEVKSYGTREKKIKINLKKAKGRPSRIFSLNNDEY